LIIGFIEKFYFGESWRRVGGVGQEAVPSTELVDSADGRSAIRKQQTLRRLLLRTTAPDYSCVGVHFLSLSILHIPLPTLPQMGKGTDTISKKVPTLITLYRHA
jgi:hypothetical protein